MSDKQVRNVIIIGSGPAGLTAGIYTARANLQPLLISGYEHGGQLMLTTEVENFPGFAEPIMGPKLMEEMREQAKRSGVEYLLDEVNHVDLESNPKRVVTEETEYLAHTIIISTGAAARWLDIENIQKFRDAGVGGVTTCAVCDGHFFKGGTVAVVGGGDSAMEEAAYLGRMMKKVYVVHRRNEFRASQVMQDRVLNAENIEVLWDSAIVDIKDPAAKKVTAARVKNLKTGEERDVALDAVFIAIGHTPNTKPFANTSLETDDEGYIKPKAGSLVQTNIEGVFVAGDVADKTYRQAVTAAGMGCMAAIEAERWITHKGLN